VESSSISDQEASGLTEDGVEDTARWEGRQGNRELEKHSRELQGRRRRVEDERGEDERGEEERAHDGHIALVQHPDCRPNISENEYTPTRSPSLHLSISPSLHRSRSQHPAHAPASFRPRDTFPRGIFALPFHKVLKRLKKSNDEILIIFFFF